MQWLHRTLRSAEENLALDEALLESAIAGERGETLRVWEADQPFVVLGRSSRHREEVEIAGGPDLPVLRRVSGGLSIVTGPGCLMYAVVLSSELRPELAAIDRAHDVVLGRVAEALRAVGVPAERRGTSDLALPPAEGEAAPRKFSGNSLRASRGWVLYHGTLLYDFDLPLIARVLRSPPRSPDYRQGRNHRSFIANADFDPTAMAEALRAEWGAQAEIDPASEAALDRRTNRLVVERYSRGEWNTGR